MTARRPTFLLVDDNAFDARLLKAAFARTALAPDVQVLDDGQLAVEFVQAVAAGLERAPDLVILDLNLPKRSGFEVLTEIKATPGLRATPVVVFSTSRSPEDAELAERLGACYLRKPSGLDAYEDAVGEIARLWERHARSEPT